MARSLSSWVEKGLLPRDRPIQRRGVVSPDACTASIKATFQCIEYQGGREKKEAHHSSDGDGPRCEQIPYLKLAINAVFVSVAIPAVLFIDTTSIVAIPVCICFLTGAEAGVCS